MIKCFKDSFLLIIFFAVTSAKGQDKSKDEAEILKVIKLYLSVTDSKDSTAILASFHPDAKLLSVNKNGELKIMSLNEWWSRVSRIPNPKIRKCAITTLDITGVSASIRVEFDTSCDHISLLKLNNGWRIVNKTLSIVL